MTSTQLRNVVLAALIVVALASSLWAVWPWCTGDWKGLALNFGTEMAGAVVTYLLLELVIRRREEREAKLEAEKQQLEARKADLIAQMGSTVKDVAIPAAEELRRHGWLWDGSLRDASLDGADLQGAHLVGASLQGAHLVGASLQGAHLYEANLQGANLIQANLQGADLARANLQGANLEGANLQEADLFRANLQEAEFHEHTTLPDGTKWTPDADLARFTDPTHPDYWEPPRPPKE